MSKLGEFDINEIAPWKRIRPVVFSHLVYWIKHPDEGSPFEVATRSIRWLPGWALIVLLLATGRRAIVLTCRNAFGVDEVVAHMVWQWRDDYRLHMFSVETEKPWRRRGIMTGLLSLLVKRARRKPRLRGLRLGGGGDKNVQGFVDKLSRGQIVGLDVSAKTSFDGYVDFW